MHQMLGALLVMRLLLSGSAAAQDDTTPPDLTAFSLPPTVVDTTAGSADVTVNFAVTDDLSGAEFIIVVFLSPSGNQVRSSGTDFAPATRAAGSFQVSFPQFGEAGIWTVDRVPLGYAVGSFRTISTATLRTPNRGAA